MADGATSDAPRADRKAIGVTGKCVIILDGEAATDLLEVLRRWLRR